jgi:hypothetical protein
LLHLSPFTASRFRAQLGRMLWIVRPEVPLNPTYRPNFLLDHEHVRRLSAIHTRTIFRLNTWQIKSLIPPGRDVGGGKSVRSSDRNEMEAFVKIEPSNKLSFVIHDCTNRTRKRS